MQLVLWMFPMVSLIIINLQSLNQFHKQVLSFESKHITLRKAQKELTDCAQLIANRANLRASLCWLRAHLDAPTVRELDGLESQIPTSTTTTCKSPYAPKLLGAIRKEVRGFYDPCWPNWAVEIRRD